MIASDRCNDVAFQDKIKREFLCCAHPRRGQCLRRRNQRHDHQEVHQKELASKSVPPKDIITAIIYLGYCNRRLL